MVGNFLSLLIRDLKLFFSLAVGEYSLSLLVFAVEDVVCKIEGSTSLEDVRLVLEIELTLHGEIEMKEGCFH